MRTDRVVKLLVSLLIAILGTLAGEAHARGVKYSNWQGNAGNGLQEGTFSLTQLPESPNQYSLVISGTEEQVISGSFTIDQLQILKAIMTDAQKFALNGEGAGPKDPITTRFEDKRENAFVVDVQKDATQSKLFLTLSTEIGRMTIKAGSVIRGTRREEGFFFDLLGRLESTLPKPAKPAK
jgi:hypothetical protein